MSRTAQKTHEITTTKQLRALRAPVRHRIIAAMTRLKSCSVKELAPHVGMMPESLYYHVRKLEGAGLIRVKERRIAGKREEKVYEPAAPRIVMDRRNRSRAFLDALGDVYGAVLRATDRSLRRALDREKMQSRGPRTATDVRQLTVRLDAKSAAEVRGWIDELMDFLSAHDDPEGVDAYTLTTVFNLSVADLGRIEMKAP